MMIFGSVIFASMQLTGCRGFGIENDSEILADYMCKFIKLSEQKKAGDNSVEGEMKKLESEVDSILKGFKVKYTSAIDKLKFEEACKNDMLKCE